VPVSPFVTHRRKPGVETKDIGPRPALELLLIFGLVWLGLCGGALAPPLRVFGHELARAELFGESPSVAIAAEPAGAPRRTGAEPSILSTAPASDETPAIDPSPQRILILGDSMIEGLLPRLADYAAENGHSVSAVIWYGSRTIDWARGNRLSDALRDFRPTFVMFVVGSSELTTRDIEKRSSAVRQMLKAVGERKWIWVGPPNWRADTGLGAMLEREVGAGHYFRSRDLTFERKRDGIHPTLAASQRWMDAVAGWLVSKSAVPVRMSTPQKSGAPRPSARVFPPPTQ
jgi:hypothetical protein